jgi:hypothetical protein
MMCSPVKISVVIVLLLVGYAGAQDGFVLAKQGPPAGDSKKDDPSGLREVICTDGSVFKAKLLSEKVTITTEFGKLSIPVEKITSIEGATRLSEADATRVKTAIAGLASEDFAARNSAEEQLSGLKLKAYPALLEAAKSSDVEVKARAEKLVKALEAQYSPEERQIQPLDVVKTAEIRAAGKIETATLKIYTEQFGELTLNLTDVRQIRFPPPHRPLPADFSGGRMTH